MKLVTGKISYSSGSGNIEVINFKSRSLIYSMIFVTIDFAINSPKRIIQKSLHLELEDQNTADHFTAERKVDRYFIHPKPDNRYNQKMYTSL